jgi:hypothetical protein
MGKGFSHPEIYFLLSRRLTPGDLIWLGYSRTTVYRYISHYPLVQRALKEALAKMEKRRKK